MTQSIKRLNRNIVRFDKHLRKFLMMKEHNHVVDKVLSANQGKHYIAHRFELFTVITPQDMGNTEIMPCFVAHTDTVSDKKPTRFDLNDGVLTNPDGVLGADDRAGCWSIFRLMEENIRAIFILTDLEECGGVGASACAESTILAEISENISSFIELDRRGGDDCALYGFDNMEFVKLFEDRGYQQAMGSYTDIVDLSGATEIASINLSVGYDNEHTKRESLDLHQLNATLQMLLTNLPPELYKNKYIAEESVGGMGSYYGGYQTAVFAVKCEICDCHDKLWWVEDMMLCSYCAGVDETDYDYDDNTKGGEWGDDEKWYKEMMEKYDD